jgi:AraC-like DNA-binding protein/Tfp pilus assembly protein PilF
MLCIFVWIGKSLQLFHVIGNYFSPARLFKWCKSLILIFLFFVGYGQNQVLEAGDHTQDEIFVQYINNLYDSISTITDYTIKKRLSDSVFAITAQKNELAHVHSLLFQVMRLNNPRTDYFDEAYQLAKKHHRIDDMCLVEYSRGQYYIARRQFDSAMVHILNYRNMTSQPHGEGNNNIVNLMGDIYYHAGLYEQAREVYHDLYQQYKEEQNWNFYRPYVMMNNLGQIALKTGKPQEANRWFRQSLQLAEQYLRTPYLNNTLAYTKIKLSETAMAMDSLPLAEKWLDEVLAIPEQNLQEDVVQELTFCRANLLYKQGRMEEAKDMAMKLLPDDTIHFSDYRFVPDIYNLLSDINLAQGDYSTALNYHKQQDLMEDSLKEREHLARSMIILAEKEHQETKNKLQAYKLRYQLVLAVIISLVVIFLIFLWFYRKLYQSRVALVNRQIEKNQEKVILEKENQIKSEWDEEWETQYRMIVKLQLLLKNEKPHLDPHLSIQHLADLMNTNRTYLSKAINTVLETNFSKFINEYRISEAIKLISEEFTLNHTVEALAQHSGFANRAVFNSAFKKQTGVTPSFFIANYKRKKDDLSGL